MASIQIFRYQEQAIEFDLSTQKLMVNATEMAKIFNARINDFFSNEATKRFIEVCLKNGNSRFLGIETIDDLYTSRQRSGTWMHRILALKFAAWLDPEFELWVYLTIDEILFGKQREQHAKLSQAAKDELRRMELEAQFAGDPDYCELQSLRAKKTHFIKETKQAAEMQLKLFTGQQIDN